MRVLDERQAYAAMYRFLKGYWEREQPEYLGLLLSEMSSLPDGGSADPAVDAAWQEAVEYALGGGGPDNLTLTRK